MAASEVFYKCGEITTSIQVGKKVYALNCIFCETVCMQLETFASHVEENHSKNFYLKEETSEEESALDKSDEDSLRAIKLHQPEIQELETWTLYDNPLQEGPMGVNSFAVIPINSANVKKEDENEAQDEFVANSMEDQDVIDIKIDKAFEENDRASNTDIETESYSEIESDNIEDDEMNENDASSKDLLPALITEYEKNPLLWDHNHPDANSRRKREDALQKMVETLQQKCNVSLSTKAVSEQIIRIRYKFRSELQSQKMAETKGAEASTSIYYDKLSFLKESIKYKPRNKRGTKALANEKPPLPLPNLTHQQNMQLIEIYKSFPCLWDMKHLGFRFKEQRAEAIDKMIQALKAQMNLDITQNELLKKLYRIRYACTQEKHRKLECDRTQKEFKPSSKYFEHISFLIENVGPFRCDFCEKIFNGPDQYRVHKSTHDGSMPFTCPICSRGFMKVGNCTVHLRRHTRDFPFECKVCGKRYATSTDVNVHMRYHTGEKPYFCDVCGQSFRTWSFFDTHMRRHQKKPSHKCTICFKAFYENNKLNEHMKAHLNVRDKICNVCGKAFTSSKYLRQHKQIHAEVKKYVCKICHKDFAQYAGLSGHMKSHGTTLNGGISAEENR